MSKQTQFIVLDVNHPQHPMHPVDPDNYIVLRQRYGDGQPTKSKPEDFVCVDLLTSGFHANTIVHAPTADIIICTDKAGGTYVFLGEWRNGMCSNPNTLIRDLRKDAPPAKEKVPTLFQYSITDRCMTSTCPREFDVVKLIERNVQDSDDLMLCYNINPNGDKTFVTLVIGKWNDGC